MRYLILLTISASMSIAQAQTFVEATNTPFSGVNYADIEFADIDNDNDLDVLITGAGNSGREAKLYTNDGSGNYTEVTGTFLDDVDSWTGVAFGDIDNDGDQDLLLTAYNPNYQEYTQLYTNDGTGNFTAVNSTIGNVTQGETAFIDLDNDNDLDLLITGYSEPPFLALYAVTELYLNDGTGHFTEILNTPFDSVSNSAIAFADIDNDNDVDLILSGINNLSQTITKLYTNDGAANFTESQSSTFQGVKQGSIAFSDIDNDNDQDLVITGRTGGAQAFTGIYLNTGTGGYTLASNQSITAVHESSLAVTDIDGDNDDDILISGLGLGLVSTLFINDGNGNFNALANMPFEAVTRSAVAFADVDGDQDQDLLITGHNGSNPSTKLYFNTTALALNQPNIADDFTLFPNPLTQSTTLTMPPAFSESTVFILNVNGQVIQEINSANQTTLNLTRDGLETGVYYLLAINDTGAQALLKLMVD